MFCTYCGVKMPEGARFCPACGHERVPAAVAGASVPPQLTPPLSGALPPEVVAVLRNGPGRAYAGFWARATAYSIDTMLVSLITTAVLLLISRMLGIGLMSIADNLSDSAFSLRMFGDLAIFELFSFLAMAVYFAGMESSSWRATLGKRALGIQVTDVGGGRIFFARAIGRYFAKVISSLAFCIGFLMAAFTEKKQALHDILAGTLVVKKL